MSDDVLVRVEGVSKKFCRSLRRSLWYGVQDTAADLLGRGEGAAGLRPEEFWAVDDVSFELKRGDCLGLIGHNGAGKTTLLKMLNGLIKPDKGRIEMRGRIGALIALGAGFNPILTGRENIYVNGAVLGLSKKEIDAKIDEIIDFAEIGEFIDTPVQSYSSGMQVRLGFAVATTSEPDILFVDEVLAVGDVRFVSKCLRRIAQCIGRGGSLILVSHNMAQIQRTCSSAIYMENGINKYSGVVNVAIDRYCKGPIAEMETASARMSANLDDASVRILEYGISSVDGTYLVPGCKARVWLKYASTEDVEDIVWGINILDQYQQYPLSTITSDDASYKCKLNRGKGELSLVVTYWPFSPGRVSARTAIAFRHIAGFITRRGYDGDALIIETCKAESACHDHSSTLAAITGEPIQLTAEF